MKKALPEAIQQAKRAAFRSMIDNMESVLRVRGMLNSTPAHTIAENQALCRRHFETLVELNALLPSVREDDEPTGRIRFLQIILEHDLEREVRSYAFYDVFEVGDRQLDACVEAGDGEAVVRALIAWSRDRPTTQAAMLRMFGQNVFERYPDACPSS